MREYLARYKVEVVTILVCGSVCAIVLFPFASAKLATFSRTFQNTSKTPVGAVLVRRVGTNAPLFGGDNVRHALEKRIREIRVVLGQPNGRNQPVLSWAQTRELRDGLSEEASDFCRSIVGANLRGTELQGIDLRGLNLTRCDFREANLSGALLEGASLRNARFDAANLSDIDFRSPGLDRAAIGNRVTGANYQGCNFEGVILGGQKVDCDFRGAKMRYATIIVIGTYGMDLRGADLRDAEFTPYYGKIRSPDAVFDGTVASVIFDETTRVAGLRLGNVSDTTIPFVTWAVERGAVASFPRKDTTTDLWALRQWDGSHVICRGATPEAALTAQIMQIRGEILQVTGLTYPDKASWLDVEIALQSLATKERAKLTALIDSTRGINLQGLDLSGMDLRGVQLEEALLRDTKLVGANLSDCVLRRAFIEASNFSQALIRNGDLRNARIVDSTFERAVLSDCRATSIAGNRVRFSNTQIKCVDFSRARFQNGTMAGSHLQEVNFSQAQIDHEDYRGAVLENVNWSDGILEQCQFEGALIHANDFSRSILSAQEIGTPVFAGDSQWMDAVVHCEQYHSGSFLGQVEQGGGAVFDKSEEFYRLWHRRRSLRQRSLALSNTQHDERVD